MLLVFCYEMFTLNIVLLFTVWKTISSVRGTVFYIKGPAFHSETHQIYSDWRCWLGGKKSIRPVNIDWWGAGVVICLDRGAYGPADDTASQNAIISCRQPHQHPTIQFFYYRPDALPATQPTASKHWMQTVMQKNNYITTARCEHCLFMHWMPHKLRVFEANQWKVGPFMLCTIHSHTQPITTGTSFMLCIINSQQWRHGEQ